MNSIQTNSPVAARALEFAQETKRKQEVEQQAAAKTENKMGEHHTVQVSFSQEAQIRLSEEIKQLSKADVERVESSKVNTERANAEATKALNMYHNVSKLK